MKFPSSISNSEWAVPLRIAARLLILLVITTSAYVVVAKYGGFAHPHRYLVRLQHAAAEKPELVLLGDSALFWKDRLVPDSLPLEQRIQKAFPNTTTVSISKAGSNPVLHLHSWRYLRRYGAAPRAVVVELNLRAFSSTSYYRPDSEAPRLQYQMYWDSVVSRALYRPLAIFQAIETQALNRRDYNQLLQQELAEAPAGFSLAADRQVEHARRWYGMTSREHFYLRYCVPISPEHPALDALVELINTLRKDGIAVSLYLTPIDVERGKRELGADVSAALTNNRNIILDVLTPILAKDEDVTFYDASQSLPSSAFIKNDLPANEHLFDQGLTDLLAQLQAPLESLLERNTEPR